MPSVEAKKHYELLVYFLIYTAQV